MKTIDMKDVFRVLAKYKYVLAVLLLGLVLMLWPSKEVHSTEWNTAVLEATGVPLERENEKLSAFLAEIEGVGRAEVLLSQSGAAVICDGAELASVKLSVTNAVSVYTGLGSDKITVMKMK